MHKRLDFCIAITRNELHFMENLLTPSSFESEVKNPINYNDQWVYLWDTLSALGLAFAMKVRYKTLSENRHELIFMSAKASLCCSVSSMALRSNSK